MPGNDHDDDQYDDDDDDGDDDDDDDNDGRWRGSQRTRPGLTNLLKM